MKINVLGAFIAGVVLCAGIVGGGFASAKSSREAARRQVTVKLEWVTVASDGGKISDSLVLVADSGQKASSTDSVLRGGVQTDQEAHVTPTLNKDGTVTLDLSCQVTKRGQDTAAANFQTTITVPRDET